MSVQSVDFPAKLGVGTPQDCPVVGVPLLV